MNEALKKEAIRRLENLTKKYKLNPNILKYFKEGNLYYSYMAIEGIMSSIDTINYDERYAEVVKEFEERTNSLVYHAIETGDMLSLLFVSSKPEQWQGEEERNDTIWAYVKNFAETDDSEMGYIYISSFKGALVRLG